MKTNVFVIFFIHLKSCPDRGFSVTHGRYQTKYAEWLEFYTKDRGYTRHCSAEEFIPQGSKGYEWCLLIE